MREHPLWPARRQRLRRGRAQWAAVLPLVGDHLVGDHAVSRLPRPAPPADLAVRAGTAARQGRRAVGGIALAAAVVFAVAGCAGGPIGQDTPQSSGQSFVSGSGTSLYKPGSRPVRFLGIDIRDDPTGADAFERTFQITYPSLNDPGDELALAFRGTVPPTGIPTTLVIDRRGRIAARIVGSVSYNGLKALITPVAAEHPVTTAGAAR